MPELKATTGIPAATACATAGFSGVGRGQRDGDARHLAVDRVLDQVALLGAFFVRRVLQLDVVLLRGGLGALADEIPEGVARRFVGDHGDRDARRVHPAAAPRRRHRCRPAFRRCWSTPPARRPLGARRSPRECDCAALTGRRPRHSAELIGTSWVLPLEWSRRGMVIPHCGGHRLFTVDVIRITRRSQYFVRTLGLQVKCLLEIRSAGKSPARSRKHPVLQHNFDHTETGFPVSIDLRTASIATI